MSDYDFVDKPDEHWQQHRQQHQQQLKIEQQKDDNIKELQKQLTEQKDQNQKIKESFEHFVKTAQSYTPKDKFKDFIHQLLPYDWSKSKQEIPSDIGIINKSAQVDNITQPRQEDIIAFIEEHLKQFEDKIKIQTKDQVKQIMEIKQREIVDSILQQLTKDQVTKFCEAQEMHLKQLNQKVQEITSKLISVKKVEVPFSNIENSQNQELKLQQIEQQISQQVQSLQTKYEQTNLQEKQGNQVDQLNLSFKQLGKKQKDLTDMLKESLQIINPNLKENQLTLQIQESINEQIQLIQLINSNLKKYIEDQNQIPQKFTMEDMLVKCNVSIPNPLGPLQIINQLYENSWKKRHTDPQYLPFVRHEENQNDLFKNYSIRASQTKLKLKEYCTSFRQARGDGNCFYTAFGYQFLLILLLKYDDSQFIAFINEIKKIKLSMKMNLDQIKFDNEEEESQLLNNFFYRLIMLRSIPDLEERKEQYTKQFAAYEYENDVMDGQFYGLSTIFFRNLANYVVEFSDMKEALFDRQNLLIWELECNSNEIVIAALAKYLKIHVQLLFFDNNDFNDQQQYEVNPNYHKIILLMKPGHYNIGIKENDTLADEQKQPIEQIILLIQALEEYVIWLKQLIQQLSSVSNSELKNQKFQQSEKNIY